MENESLLKQKITKDDELSLRSLEEAQEQVKEIAPEIDKIDSASFRYFTKSFLEYYEANTPPEGLTPARRAFMEFLRALPEQGITSLTFFTLIDLAKAWPAAEKKMVLSLIGCIVFGGRFFGAFVQYGRTQDIGYISKFVRAFDKFYFKFIIPGEINLLFLLRNSASWTLIINTLIHHSKTPVGVNLSNLAILGIYAGVAVVSFALAAWRYTTDPQGQRSRDKLIVLLSNLIFAGIFYTFFTVGRNYNDINDVIIDNSLTPLFGVLAAVLQFKFRNNAYVSGSINYFTRLLAGFAFEYFTVLLINFTKDIKPYYAFLMLAYVLSHLSRLPAAWYLKPKNKAPESQALLSTKVKGYGGEFFKPAPEKSKEILVVNLDWTLTNFNSVYEAEAMKEILKDLDNNIPQKDFLEKHKAFLRENLRFGEDMAELFRLLATKDVNIILSGPSPFMGELVAASFTLTDDWKIFDLTPDKVFAKKNYFGSNIENAISEIIKDETLLQKENPKNAGFKITVLDEGSSVDKLSDHKDVKVITLAKNIEGRSVSNQHIKDIAAQYQLHWSPAPKAQKMSDIETEHEIYKGKMEIPNPS